MTRLRSHHQFPQKKHRRTHAGSRACPASLVVLALVAMACDATTQVTDAVLLRGVNVVAMDSERVLESVSVLVVAGKIAGIGAPESLEVPVGSRVVEGSGRYLLPGLINSHVHIHNKEDLDQYLAFGVTTVRDMIGFDRSIAWRDGVRSGILRGPEIVQASPVIYDGDNPAQEGQDVTGPEHGRQVVAGFADDGYDLVKIVQLRDRDSLRAVVDEAAAHGMVVAGHIPDHEMTIQELANSGMASAEHILDVLTILGDDPDPSRIRELAAAFADSGLVVTPMLLPALATNEFLDDPDGYLNDSRRAYIKRYGGAFGVMRMQGFIDRASGLTDERRTRMHADLDLGRRAIRILHEAGVPLVIGTEGKHWDWAAGEGLHREMELFLQAGLSPYAVLRAATADAASLLGIADRKGTIAVGMNADFILVDGNPLEDLATLRVPSAMTLAGTFLDAATLSHLREAM